MIYLKDARMYKSSPLSFIIIIYFEEVHFFNTLSNVK